jgi:ribose-phosphate pyrophosphokinase
MSAGKFNIWSNERRFAYDRLTFSGGEAHVRVDEPAAIGETARIHANVRTAEDLFELVLLTDALRRAGARSVYLCMPYLPYARQDRVCAPGEALSLRVVCDFINAQHYAEVEIWDAHSDVALALIDRVRNIRAAEILTWFPVGSKKTVLVAPDAGALKKVMEVSKNHSMPFVRADKTRDPATGQISGTVVYSDHIGDGNFLIVDDICDGGRTFIELAKQLRPLTNGEVHLYVTHGIFSKGPEVFDGLIDRVFVANSFVEDLPANFMQSRV